MSKAARIDSVSSLKAFRAGMVKIQESVKTGLEEADADVRQATNWLVNDRLPFWKQQIARWHEKLVEAKSALNRKKLYKSPVGGKQSAVDEERALAHAKKQYEEAQRKYQITTRWVRTLEKEILDYRTATQGTTLMIENELPVGLAKLDNMIDAVEKYHGVQDVIETTSTAEAGSESMSRGQRPDDESKTKDAPASDEIETDESNEESAS